MDRIEVIAEGAHGLALSGNKYAICLCLGVTRPEGTPIAGLTKKNFRVRQIAGSGTLSSNVVQAAVDFGVGNAPWSGFYTLFVNPAKNQIWAAGEYVYAVVVHSGRRARGAFEGRALAKATVPLRSTP